MTREDIISMAREARIDAWWESGNEVREVLQDHLEHFAGLVAAFERDACAKVCENFNADHQDCNYYDRAMAAAIRARGKK